MKLKWSKQFRLGQRLFHEALRSESHSNMHRKNYHLIMLALDWTRNGDPALSLGHSSILSSLRKQCADNQLEFNSFISSIEIGVNDNDYKCDPAKITKSILYNLAKIRIYTKHTH